MKELCLMHYSGWFLVDFEGMYMGQDWLNFEKPILGNKWFSLVLLKFQMHIQYSELFSAISHLEIVSPQIFQSLCQNSA